MIREVDIWTYTTESDGYIEKKNWRRAVSSNKFWFVTDRRGKAQEAEIPEP